VKAPLVVLFFATQAAMDGIHAIRYAAPVHLNLGWISHDRSALSGRVIFPQGEDLVKTFLLLSFLCSVFVTNTRAEEDFDSSIVVATRAGTASAHRQF